MLVVSIDFSLFTFSHIVLRCGLQELLKHMKHTENDTFQNQTCTVCIFYVCAKGMNTALTNTFF